MTPEDDRRDGREPSVSPPERTSLVWADALGIPNAITQTLANETGVKAAAARLAQSDVTRIVASGNGASYYAALALSLASLAQPCGVSVTALPAGVFVHGRYRWQDGDYLLVFSSSGELRDIVNAQKALGIGQFALVTASPESTLNALAETTLVVSAPDQRSLTHTQSYVAALAASLLLVARLTGDDELELATRATPDLARRNLEHAPEWIDGLALDRLPPLAIAFGTSVAWAAALETALLLKEIAGVPCEGVESREGATSAMFALTDGSLAISLETASDPHLTGTEESCRSMGSRIVRIPCREDDDPRLVPILSFPYALALALRLAELAGRDPDDPPWAENYLSSVRAKRATAPIRERPLPEGSLRRSSE